MKKDNVSCCNEDPQLGTSPRQLMAIALMAKPCHHNFHRAMLERKELMAMEERDLKKNHGWFMGQFGNVIACLGSIIKECG